jgi:hypothetical protein
LDGNLILKNEDWIFMEVASLCPFKN